jgi:hypothetical protein
MGNAREESPSFHTLSEELLLTLPCEAWEALADFVLLPAEFTSHGSYNGSLFPGRRGKDLRNGLTRVDEVHRKAWKKISKKNLKEK